MGGRGNKGGSGPSTPKNGPNAPATPATPTPAPGSPGSPGGGGGGGGKGGGKSPGTTTPGGVTNPQGGGGKKGGGGPTSTPAPPPAKKWYDALPRHGQKFETDDDYKRQAVMVNPRHNEPVGPNKRNDHKNNCTRVSAAWLLRRFWGLDVTAGEAPWADSQRNWSNPTVQTYENGLWQGKLYRDDKDSSKPDGDWFTADILEKWIDPATGKPRAQTKIPQKVPDPTAPNGERYMTNEEWIEKVREMILADHPEGSGGLMRITGHIFNWEIQNGKVRFIEAQPQPYDPYVSKTDPGGYAVAGSEVYTSWDKDFTKPGGDEWWSVNRKAVAPSDKLNWFMRVDDMEPSQKLFDKGWVHRLTKGEHTAPFFDEMIFQSYFLYPDNDPVNLNRRAAFRTGWDQVRRGRPPRIPTGWKNTPIEAAYRAGVAYAKGPT